MPKTQLPLTRYRFIGDSCFSRTATIPRITSIHNTICKRSEPDMPKTKKQPVKLTSEQRREVRSLVEDSGYTRADAIRIVLAGGLE